MTKRLFVIWCVLNELHLYDNKIEAFIKAFIFTISWVLGVCASHSDDMELTAGMGIAYFLFALSLIAEYIFKLVSVKKFFPKVLPSVISALSVLVAVWSSALSQGKPFHSIGFQNLWWGVVIPIVIIWFDTASLIFIEPPPHNMEDYTENNLKSIKMGG